MNTKLKAFIFGALSALAVWAVLTVADSIDEYVINTGTMLGVIVYFTMPIAMVVVYIKHCIICDPPGKQLILWFAGYYILYIPIWMIIYNSVNHRDFFITQKTRGSFLDFNGIEYMMYGISTLIMFTLFCLIFLVIKRYRVPKR